MRTISLLMTMVLLQVTGINAQTPAVTEKPVPPTGPLIKKRAPDFSKWVVSVSISKSSAKSQDDPEEDSQPEKTKNETAKFSVTKTKNVYHVRMVDAHKQVWDVWSDGKVTAREPSKAAEAAFVAPPASKDSANPLWVNFSRSDFDGFDWISAENYKGLRKFQGQSCMIFFENVMVQPAEKGKDGEPDFEGLFQESTACINVTTRLPVALIRNGITTKFRFLGPPKTMQTLPQSILALVKKREQLKQSLNRRP